MKLLPYVVRPAVWFRLDVAVEGQRDLRVNVLWDFEAEKASDAIRRCARAALLDRTAQ